MKIDSSKLFNVKNNEKHIKTEVDEIIEYGEILLSISKGLVDYRKKNNLTQEELAFKLDVKQAMISKLEGGDYNPTFKMIHAISNKLTDSAGLFCKILKDIVKNIEGLYNINYESCINFSEKVNEYNNKNNGTKKLYSFNYSDKSMIEEEASFG